MRTFSMPKKTNRLQNTSSSCTATNSTHYGVSFAAKRGEAHAVVADEHGLPEHLERHLHPPERRAHLHPLHRALHLLKHPPRALHAFGEPRLVALVLSLPPSCQHRPPHRHPPLPRPDDLGGP